MANSLSIQHRLTVSCCLTAHSLVWSPVPQCKFKLLATQYSLDWAQNSTCGKIKDSPQWDIFQFTAPLQQSQQMLQMCKKIAWYIFFGNFKFVFNLCCLKVFSRPSGEIRNVIFTVWTTEDFPCIPRAFYR